jgi:hypothetical protein
MEILSITFREGESTVEKAVAELREKLGDREPAKLERVLDEGLDCRFDGAIRVLTFFDIVKYRFVYRVDCGVN